MPPGYVCGRLRDNGGAGGVTDGLMGCFIALPPVSTHQPLGGGGWTHPGHRQVMHESRGRTEQANMQTGKEKGKLVLFNGASRAL